MALSIPTLYFVITANFLCVGLVWLFVSRSYPNFRAAKVWTAAAFVGAVGGALSLTRGTLDPAISILAGNGCLVLAAWLCLIGIQRFYERPGSWRLSAAVTAASVAAFAVLFYLRDDMPMRIAVYAVAAVMPMALSWRELVSGSGGRLSPGAKLAATTMALSATLHLLRTVAGFAGTGGQLSFVFYNNIQAILFIAVVFLAMMWNFGFLLMAIDRLRAEVENLALFDDLTGVANRRQLLARLDNECTLARRTQRPFAILAIDLDGFKQINDTHGHAAGDECLRVFTRLAQKHLRASDLLARVGGDEFTIILPDTGLRRAALVAREVVEACRAEIICYGDIRITVSASVGVAQWSRHRSADPAQLMTSADAALYTAKREGRDRHVLHDDPMPLRLSA